MSWQEELPKGIYFRVKEEYGSAIRVQLRQRVGFVFFSQHGEKRVYDWELVESWNHKSRTWPEAIEEAKKALWEAHKEHRVKEIKKKLGVESTPSCRQGEPQGANVSTKKVPLPALNTELLSQIVKWAELSNVATANPWWPQRVEEIIPGWGLWNQDTWFMGSSATNVKEGFCKTACCIAGQAALQTGWVPEDEGGATTFMHRDGVRKSVWDIGEEALGLTPHESEILFNGGNDLVDVKATVNWLYERRGLGNPYPDVHTYDDSSDY